MGVATPAEGDHPRVKGGAQPPPAEPAKEPPPAERIDLGEPPTPLEATDTFAAAGRKAMWLHVDRMLDREPELRDPGQVDSLRKYRVAMRRLRAAMRLFRDAYPRRDLKPLRDGLRALAGEVGAVRDLDVRIADLDRWAVEAGPGAAANVSPLREEWAAERRSGADALERRLGSRRHRRLLERLAAFVRTPAAADPGAEGTAPGPEGGERLVRDRVASSAWLAYERLRALAPAADGASLEALHAIRIEAKRLRYTLEFLGPVMGPQQAWLVARLVALQDHLGQLNDAAVNGAAIRSFLAAREENLSPVQRATIGAYLEAREQDVTALRGGVGRAWRPVVGATFAGRLGGAVVVVEGR